jgi:hypothetical protein
MNAPIHTLSNRQLPSLPICQVELHSSITSLTLFCCQSRGFSNISKYPPVVMVMNLSMNRTLNLKHRGQAEGQYPLIAHNFHHRFIQLIISDPERLTFRCIFRPITAGVALFPGPWWAPVPNISSRICHQSMAWLEMKALKRGGQSRLRTSSGQMKSFPGLYN